MNPRKLEHCCSLKHADAVLFLVGLLLEEHVVNEEASSDQGCLAPYIQVHWEARKQIFKTIRCILNISFDPPCTMYTFYVVAWLIHNLVTLFLHLERWWRYHYSFSWQLRTGKHLSKLAWWVVHCSHSFRTL